jgi:organic hydroperoxide reductase OsmC/OhrA
MTAEKDHSYQVTVRWTGNQGQGTRTYAGYKRDHEIIVDGKELIPGSSDPNFRGDPTRYNPEELLVASLSTCHMLWYLHLCSASGIIVTDYQDSAKGAMKETSDGGGHFTEVRLRPAVIVAPGANLDLARSLHEKAHHLCFIANSVNFPVRCDPSIKVE